MHLTANFKNIFARSLFAICFICISTLTTLAAGEVDPTFNASIRREGGSAYTAVTQPDGKTLVAGLFTTANEAARSGVVRFNEDGTVDNSFDVIEVGGVSGQGGKINAIALQSDGKIVIGGDFTYVNSTARKSLARLNSDGSLDTTVAAYGNELSGEVTDIKIYPDNRILIIGPQLVIFGGINNTRGFVIRLNPNGSVDTTFDIGNSYEGAFVAIIQSDGKVLVGGRTFLRRFESNGLTDSSFTPATVSPGIPDVGVRTILAQPDGKFLIGGGFNQINGFTTGSLARINNDGSLDATFNYNTINGYIYKIESAGQGKIYVGGTFTAINNVPTRRFARLNSDGTVDTAYTSPLPNSYLFYNSTPANNGKIIIVGDLPFDETPIIRLNADGSLDDTFNARIGRVGLVQKVFVQADGKVVVSGNFSKANSTVKRNIARFNADGTLDTGFNATIIGNFIFAIAQQADGKLLVSGANISQFDIVRLNTDGSLDSSFNVGIPGQTRAIVVQPDGKIVFSSNGSVRRVNSDGSNDASFTNLPISTGSGGVGTIDIELQPDGKILIAGDFTFINGAARGRIARLNADGTLDNSFLTTLGANNTIYEIARQTDGKILVGGIFTGINGVNRSNLARLNADGTLDSSLTTVVNSPVQTVVVQPNGKILIGGGFSTVNGITRIGAARINADGSTDFSFTANTNNLVNSLALQSDGKIIAGGLFSRVNNFSRVGVVRLLSATASLGTLFDYEGDGRADIAVFRPSNLFYYRLNSSNGQFVQAQFGQANSQIVPADYDGDGKTDLAYCTQNAANETIFNITDSLSGTVRQVQFGAVGDIPVPGDWDGDGKADFAVYRPGAGGGQSYFYYRPSSQPAVNFYTIPWGTTGDRPLRGDFDGDGKQDAAVFRSSTGSWFVLYSSNNQFFGINFGQAGDITTPADFDGDGRTDVAVYRPSNGGWYRINSSNGSFTGLEFGVGEDIPVAADYDGDGKADVAVWRPSNGFWYLLRSTQGFASVQWGANGDKPIPAAYNQF